ncbi:perosamine synthetase [Candidatus Methanophagaceae archaeon]|nr:perosamine synthetase [Methanophagales archaeon]
MKSLKMIDTEKYYGTNMIPVSEPNITEKELEYVTDAVKSTWISSTGKYIDHFESVFADYIGTKHALTVSNGTVALHVALLSLGIGPGDEVIVPALTYIATANAVTYTGATPVFTDSEPDTWNMYPDSIERLITQKTKAIIVVHLYGHPCDMDKINSIAKRNNLYVIEDAAEAIGSEYENKKVGRFGDIATFSFYGNKTITTGEGGMVVTNDDELANKVQLLKGQGMSPVRRYWFDVVGYNYRLTNMQAAIGCAQMERIEELVAKKRQVASWYNELLADIKDITLPVEKSYAKNTYWMYSILINSESEAERDAFMEYLSKNGIETRPFFYLMTDMMPYKNYKSDDLTIAERIAAQGVNLPSSTLLEYEHIEQIVKQIRLW